MTYREQLEKLIESKKGLILTKDASAAGIPRVYLSIFVDENKLERISHGVYLTPDAFDDEMYRIQARNSRVIFSHETALYLHDLTDRDPLKCSVTVPFGYNASHLKEDGIIVYTVKKTLYELGIMEMKTVHGRPIKVYNKERTIGDIVKNRNNMDVAILNDAIKRYLDLKERNIPLLLRYAKELGVENILSNHLGVLL